jgi:hypothetical protein
MNTKSKLGFVVVVAVSGTIGTALASESTFNPVDDAMIFGNGSNYLDTGKASGKGPGMFAGADGNSSRKRSLVRFDLTGTALSGSAIGSGATVDSVTLTLVIGQIAGSGGGDGGGSPPGPGGGGCGSACTPAERTFSLYVVNSTWHEGNSGSNACGGGLCANMSGTGQGWTAVTGDVTWKYTSYSSTQWTAQPTDQDYTTPAAMAKTFDNFTFQLPMAFEGDSMNNTGLVSAVQAWVTTPSSNHGFEIKSGDESTATSFIGWWTKDGAAANSNNSISPVLDVVYH